MNASAPIIDVQNIRFHFNSDTIDILHDISLQVFPESINAILGPNGSGKTTLLRLLLGILKPTGGDIVICGRSIQGEGYTGLKRRISIVPQTEPVSFELNILEYVLLGRAPHLNLFQLPGEKDHAIALQAIDTVGLRHMIRRSVSSLSGGENQLARIARALAQETDVILLDEPTAHLDLANIQKVTGIMHHLAQQGKTIIYTTNDPNIVSIAANRVFMLKDHRIIAAGAPVDVFTSDNLSRVYGIDVEVFLKDGRAVVMIGVNK